MKKTFKSLVVSEDLNGDYVSQIVERKFQDLPKGEVTIKVSYSSINYKDALSMIGNKGVTKAYPHTPGIDAAGYVFNSESADFKEGDRVIVTGYDLGMNTDGGFSEFIRVPASWVVPCPEGLSLKAAMIYGTAGFTAAKSVYRIVTSGVQPKDGPILVTGGTGGVGSLAIQMMDKLGYEVYTATGKMDQVPFLKALGAKEVLERSEVTDETGKPMLKGRWAGVIDTVGGPILSTAIKSVQFGGSVTCCGNVASADIDMNVYPFILRDVKLFGIASAETKYDLRCKLWALLEDEYNIIDDKTKVSVVGLGGIEEVKNEMLSGQHKGRTIVDLSK